MRSPCTATKSSSLLLQLEESLHSSKDPVQPKINTQINKQNTTVSERSHIGHISHGFPGSSVVKNPPANEGDVSLIPRSGRSPGKRYGNPLQYSCLGNPMDKGAWRATVLGVTKRAGCDLVTKTTTTIQDGDRMQTGVCQGLRRKEK